MPIVCRCQNCKGKGRLPCATCRSHGLIECQTCQGAGSLLTRKVAIVRWYVSPKSQFLVLTISLKYISCFAKE